MPRSPKEPLRPLTPQEYTRLTCCAQATSERVDCVCRARALLAVAAGHSFRQAAVAATLRSGTTVANLVRRFNCRGLAALLIAPGRGARPTYTSTERLYVLQELRRPPDRKEDGTATWSLHTLERTLRRTGLPHIGASTIRRILHAAEYSYQRTRTWCQTGTALRQRKTGPVLVQDPDKDCKTVLITQAYKEAERAGLLLYCQDEAGPYQTIPQPGASWQPVGHAPQHPHEYLRNGTAKLLTLFRPATGELRARGVRNAPNVVLHPWLKEEIRAILAATPLPPDDEAKRPVMARWVTWLGHIPRRVLPPLRMILVWDNLTGHTSADMVAWLFDHGVLPLYTPLSGSWLNMAESVQRIIVPRALAGQHPHDPEEIIAWLEETVEGWNRCPTPFVWGGKRQERRRRARQRRLGGSGATMLHPQLFAA